MVFLIVQKESINGLGMHQKDNHFCTYQSSLSIKLFLNSNAVADMIKKLLRTDLFNDILIGLFRYIIMSKLFTLHSDVFLEDDEHHQITEYLKGKMNPKEQEFLTEGIAFYEKHRHDSDDSI